MSFRLDLRSPTTNDASKIWQLVVESGVLDPNSAYLYLLLCRDFSDTCLVAVRDDSVVGFVTAYRLPRAPHVLFVWQIGVAPEARRQHVALRLLSELLKRCDLSTLTFIEATVASSNTASRKLFAALARSLDAPLDDLPHDGFSESQFPPGQHQAEPRIRIGPLRGTDLKSVTSFDQLDERDSGRASSPQQNAVRDRR